MAKKIVHGKSKYRIHFNSFISILALMTLWEGTSRIVGQELILPSPGRVIQASLQLYGSVSFLQAIAGTFIRVLGSFLICILAGAMSGIPSGIKPEWEAFFSPLLTTVRATPVLAVILIAMLWFPSGLVPVFSAFLMAYPVMHASFTTGVAACDTKLLEMARLFGVPRKTIFISLRLPSAMPQLLAGSRTTLGLCWKVVVAGEVLSQPEFALGSGLQQARIWLETPRVLAWAAATVILCGLSEWLLGLLARKALHYAA